MAQAPLVFLPGLFETSAIWRPTIARIGLGAHPRLMTELPGHAAGDESEQVRRALASGDWLRRLSHRIAARFPGRRPVLIGHSTGATVALELARRWPERVASVVAVGALTSGHRGRALDPLARLLANPLLGPAAFRTGWNYWLSSPARFRSGLDWAASGPLRLPFGAAMRRELAACDPMAVRACATWVLGLDIRESLPDVRIPVFALIGTRDRVVPPDQQLEIVRLAPQAHAQLVDAGHLLFTEAPRAFERALQGWLRVPTAA